ncbi:hypothetical protein GEV27_10540 [Aeromicrobium sp. S22]|uniref:hypothetical protein n=1 Tax=Aeromicrobium sp. S22 TaxID=2662029 RepID=UPI00129DA58C|nr:hypothetical protein [Aeromicrobium sp. S22]MRK01960.1 hypothetical protein [Aeromicrobium sp. S22]
MQFETGDRLLYMKVGVHAQETLEDIIERKQREIEAEGWAMWGYGGNTCHPYSMVQPFVAGGSGPIYLAMQPMKSKHSATPVRASEYSPNGVDWETIPPGIDVLGSRMALCIDTLEQVETELDLGTTRVAVGPSKGRSGIDYIGHRVDKACFEVGAPRMDASRPVKIELAARLRAPYAVLVRD